MKNILLLILAVVFFSSGCSNVPVTTMIKMRNFGVDDVVNLKPDEVKVKLQVPETMVAGPNSARLEISALRKDGTTEKYYVRLSQYKQHQETKGVLFKEILNDYYFEVSEEGINDLVKIQNALREKDIYKSFHIGSIASFNMAEKLDEFEMSLFIKLKKEEDFILIFDDANIEIEIDKSSAQDLH